MCSSRFKMWWGESFIRCALQDLKCDEESHFPTILPNMQIKHIFSKNLLRPFILKEPVQFKQSWSESLFGHLLSNLDLVPTNLAMEKQHMQYTSFIVFGLTRPGFESKIFHIEGKHTNHYTTNVPNLTSFSAVYFNVIF
jgi:hypothetical protein